jgi:hypothetical protein
MKANIGNYLVGVIVLLVLLNMSAFVVDQRQTAIVFQLGEMVGEKTSPVVFQTAIGAERAFSIRASDFDSPSLSVLRREEKRLGGLFCEMAYLRCEAVLHQRGRRRDACADALAANGECVDA